VVQDRQFTVIPILFEILSPAKSRVKPDIFPVCVSDCMEQIEKAINKVGNFTTISLYILWANIASNTCISVFVMLILKSLGIKQNTKPSSIEKR
jgi:hypothetical protein